MKCFYQPREHKSVKKESLSVKKTGGHGASLFQTEGSRNEMGTSTVISGCLWKKKTGQTRALVSLYGHLWYNFIKNFMVEIAVCCSCCLEYKKKTAWKCWKLHLNVRQLFTATEEVAHRGRVVSIIQHLAGQPAVVEPPLNRGGWTR